MSLHERARLWYRALQPSEIDKVIDEYKGKESLKETLFNIFLSSLLQGVATLIAVAAGFALIGLFLEPSAVISFEYLVFMGGVGALFGTMYAAVMVIVTPIAFFLIQAMHYGLARLFGGKGSFTQQAFFMGLVSAAVTAASVLVLIPCAGALAVSIAAVIGIYIDYRIIKNIHSLSTNSAAAVALIPQLVWFVIYILLEVAARY